MKLKEMIFRNGKKQIEIAKAIGCCPCLFNKALNGWIVLPQKYQEKLCSVLGISEAKLKGLMSGEVKHE